MTRNQLITATMILTVVSLLVYFIIQGAILGQDWLYIWSMQCIGVLTLFFVLYFNLPKKIDRVLKIEVNPKELDPKKAYMFQTDQILSPGEFKAFADGIRSRYKHKSNLIVNGNAVIISDLKLRPRTEKSNIEVIKDDSL